MLEMSSRTPVTRTDTPAVRLKVDVALTHRNHGLDSDTHTRLEHYAVTSAPIVGHLWVLMHLTTYAVTGQLTYYAVARRFAEFLNSAADVAQMVSGDGILYTLIERGLRDLQQLLHFFGDLTHTKRVARVAIEATEQRPTINGNDVTILQHIVGVWHAVNNNIVDRCTDAGRERTAVGIREALERGNRMMITDEFISNLVKFQGRYSRSDMFR